MIVEKNIISVTGKGSIHVVPDVTRLEVTVGCVFKNYEAAYSQAKENSAWMVKILEYNGKSRKLAKTTCLDITPADLAMSDTVKVEWQLIGKNEA